MRKEGMENINECVGLERIPRGKTLLRTANDRKLVRDTITHVLKERRTIQILFRYLFSFS